MDSGYTEQRVLNMENNRKRSSDVVKDDMQKVDVTDEHGKDRVS